MSRRGISRRGFLVSATAAGSVAAGGYALWRGNFEPSESKASATRSRNAFTGIIPGEPLALLPSGKLLDTDYRDPFAGGRMLGYLPFAYESPEFRVPGQKTADGHDARRVIDLASLLTTGGRSTPSNLFYVRTEYPDRLVPPADWKIKVHGEVKIPEVVSLDSLRPHVESQGPVLLECSGNARELDFGLLSVADWAGIPIQKIIERAQPTSKAKCIFVNGFDEDSRPSRGNHSKPTCSWIFTFDQLLKARAFLATELNNGPLPKDQGAPVRLVVPGWYGCTEAKWVDEIRFIDNNQLATLQMLEFAGRTLQDMRPSGNPEIGGVGPEWAREYRPATIDQAAVPVRVEQWKLGDKFAYRIVGITWGGPTRTNKLLIGFSRGSSPQYVPVDFCAVKTSNREYGIWTHHWEPPRKGGYWISIRFGGSTRSRKMAIQRLAPSGAQIGYYDRAVYIPEVRSHSV